MEVTTRTVNDAIGAVANEDHRHTMIALDQRIQMTLPDRAVDVWEGTFWGGTHQTIIGYGRLLQPRPKGDDVRWFLVGLAAQQHHVSVYLNAVVDGQYALRKFDGMLGNVTVGSANIGIKRLADLDMATFEELLAACDAATPSDAW